MTKEKKPYRKPEIVVIRLDNSISLVMMTVNNPDPRSGTKSDPKSDPFSSPFDNQPFG
jgi:hypothetical protein